MAGGGDTVGLELVVGLPARALRQPGEQVFAVEFGNPDFVAYARSFGIAGFRPESSADLYPTLMRALEVDGPSVVAVPIDYRENLRLTEHLGELSSVG